MITIKPFSSLPKIKHGFFTRKGGVSNGLYSSLNCGFGSGDRVENINTNRNCTLSELGAPNTSLLTCNQIHSFRALVVTSPWSTNDRPKADGMVTAVPGITLGILTADCAPIFFYDYKKKIIGCTHAGWRGALNGVIRNTVKKFNELNGQDVKSWMWEVNIKWINGLKKEAIGLFSISCDTDREKALCLFDINPIFLEIPEFISLSKS